MQDDEILRLVHLFAGLGFDKFRLTGGEPTVRANIVDLVHGIAHTPGVRSLSMTTNGVIFDRLARPLAQAGLQRVNFSLDTLDARKFERPSPAAAGWKMSGRASGLPKKPACFQLRLMLWWCVTTTKPT